MASAGATTMTSTELERALAVAGLDAPVRWREVTGSTNTLAAELAESGAPEWTIVGAGHQTAGRGRRGRAWLDRPGRSLMTSFVLRPPLPPDALGLLTVLAGASWAEAASETTGLEVRCKWPNDLLIGEAKVGGVLAESSVAGGGVRWVVVGSGINLAPSGIEGSASLGEVDRPALLGSFLARFRRGYETPPEALAEDVLERWSAVSATLGERVSALGTDGRRTQGVATAVDGSGRLILDVGGRRVTVASERIEHLR
jgi:BirA family biotin operon repressor/biotin-[acetyl-CoA-carboxylase] ligase